MNRRGFLALLGLGAATAPVPRRVYSFLWAPPEPELPFFGIDRVAEPRNFNIARGCFSGDYEAAELAEIAAKLWAGRFQNPNDWKW